jgi:transcriptional regulator with XRE-family HTH domain
VIPYPTFVATLAAQGTDLDALGIDTGIPVRLIHDVMNGRKVPTLEQRARLADALGVPADELFAVLGHRPTPGWFIADPVVLRKIDRGAA